jgi:tetratricopeptide (TPR) repeat protein
VPGTEPGTAPERFADDAQASAWLHAEYQVLLGGIELAARAGFDRHAWQLARSLASFFERSGHWHDWIRAQQAAVTAAERAADQPGQAHSRHQLGNALIHLDEYEQARPELHHALRLFRVLGDEAHQAQVHMCLGYLEDCLGADRLAFRRSQQALRLFRSAGHRTGEAIALNNMSWSLARQGRHGQALQLCREALHLHEQAGDRQGQAGAWDTLGYIHHGRADHAAAIECYARAADFYRQIHCGFNEGDTLIRLGDAYHAAGDHRSAQRAWWHALRLHEALDNPRTAEIRSRLDQAAQARA